MARSNTERANIAGQSGMPCLNGEAWPDRGGVRPSGENKREEQRVEILISIVIPVYDAMKYLERCVESILCQSFQEYELILVDDGSDDGSGALCDSYGAAHANIKVIHKKNAGLGCARNDGIEAAVGKYIVFVDADDYLGDDHLLNLYKAIEENQADCAIAGYTLIYLDGKLHACPCVKENRLFTEKEIQELMFNCFGALPDSRQDVPYGQAVWSKIYKRQVLMENHIRFVSERVYIAEDLVFHLDFFRYAKCAVAIPDVSYYYNCANVKSVSKIHRTDRSQQDIRLKEYMEEKLRERFEPEEYTLYLQRSLIMRIAFDIVQEVLYHDHKDKSYPMRASVKAILAREEFRKVICAYPWWKLSFQRMLLAGLMRFRLVEPLIWAIRIRQFFRHSSQNI